MAPDPRRVVGALVETKAKFVTADSECKRRFGSLWMLRIRRDTRGRKNETDRHG